MAKTYAETLVHRVFALHAKVHPGYYHHMVWRMTEETAEIIAKALGVVFPSVDVKLMLLGVDIQLYDEFSDTDELLLVVKG